MTTAPSANTDNRTSAMDILNEKGKKRLSDLSSANGETKGKNETSGQRMRRNTGIDPSIPVYFPKTYRNFGPNFKPNSEAGSVLE